MIYTAINPQRPALEAASGEGLLAGEQKRSLQIEGAAAAAAVYSSRGCSAAALSMAACSPVQPADSGLHTIFQFKCGIITAV
jgi:hypothetical protein